MSSKPKVMLIDHNEIDNFLTSNTLCESGFTNDIEVKYSVQEALDYLNNIRTLGSPLPDIVFINRNMTGVTTYEFLNEYDKLKQQAIATCLVFLLVDSKERNDGLPGVMNSCISGCYEKPLLPLDLDEISQKIARPLNKAG